MKHLRYCAVALAFAFLLAPAAPLGGIIPTVGGNAHAEIPHWLWRLVADEDEECEETNGAGYCEVDP
ncbi:MAG: hypothetical protein F4Y26_05585, partial [Gammaproteobacteria bacterium]|nr:hypothetical protein [Gammaproteobacteria bacterium]